MRGVSFWSISSANSAGGDSREMIPFGSQLSPTFSAVLSETVVKVGFAPFDDLACYIR